MAFDFSRSSCSFVSRFPANYSIPVERSLVNERVRYHGHRIEHSASYCEAGMRLEIAGCFVNTRRARRDESNRKLCITFFPFCVFSLSLPSYLAVLQYLCSVACSVRMLNDDSRSIASASVTLSLSIRSRRVYLALCG